MDTISQENNESFSWLPMLALIIGLIAGVLAGIALAKVTNLDKAVAAQSALAGRIDDLEAEVRKTSTATEQATQRLTKVANDTNTAFKQFSDAFTTLRTDFAALEEKAKAPPPVVSTSSSGSGSGSGSSGPAVAAPGEYIVKSGDTGTKIARANGVSLGDLISVNPGVDWNRLHVGQAIKLPKK